MKYLVLDIGCGSRPNGSINLDLDLGKNEHHFHDYDVTEIPFFTRGALPTLPYRDLVFDGSFCSHVLEHTWEPYKALKEIARVTKDLAILIVPNNPVYQEHPEHYYSWSKTSFKNFCELEFESVEVRAQCRFFQLKDYWAFRKILAIGYFKKPIARFLSRLIGIEIVAICRKGRAV